MPRRLDAVLERKLAQIIERVGPIATDTPLANL